MKSRSLLKIGSIAIIILGAGFTLMLPVIKKPWPVPDTDNKKVNPVVSNAASIADGKTLWNQHCQSCHGKKGMGDGSKAAQLKTEPGDFSKAETQVQSNGALFYKTNTGRGDMPSFKRKIPDAEDLWNLVNYIRTLKI